MGLRSPTTGSIFDDTGGTLAWIAAGRYGGHLSAPTMPHPDDADLTGESAFTELVATVGGRSTPCVRLPLYWYSRHVVRVNTAAVVMLSENRRSKNPVSAQYKPCVLFV